MIVALVSAYREGHLIVECVRSALRGCDYVLVVDAPIGEPHERGDPSALDELRAMPEYPGKLETVERQAGRRPFPSDADKRTYMLRRAQALPRREREPLWVLWLDGDELLLWPELLRDHLCRVDLEATATGGAAIRIVELDGSVAISYGKLVRGDHVRAYLESSYQVELLSGMIVALPNVAVCGAGGIPAGFETMRDADAAAQGEWLARHRPPLQGEPHLLHRSILRHPDRAGVRMHDTEAEWFPEALRAAGLEGVDG